MFVHFIVYRAFASHAPWLSLQYFFLMHVLFFFYVRTVKYSLFHNPPSAPFYWNWNTFTVVGCGRFLHNVHISDRQFVCVCLCVKLWSWLHGFMWLRFRCLLASAITKDTAEMQMSSTLHLRRDQANRTSPQTDVMVFCDLYAGAEGAILAAGVSVHIILTWECVSI